MLKLLKIFGISFCFFPILIQLALADCRPEYLHFLKECNPYESPKDIGALLILSVPKFPNQICKFFGHDPVGTILNKMDRYSDVKKGFELIEEIDSYLRHPNYKGGLISPRGLNHVDTDNTPLLISIYRNLISHLPKELKDSRPHLREIAIAIHNLNMSKELCDQDIPSSYQEIRTRIRLIFLGEEENTSPEFEFEKYFD